METTEIKNCCGFCVPFVAKGWRCRNDKGFCSYTSATREKAFVAEGYEPSISKGSAATLFQVPFVAEVAGWGCPWKATNECVSIQAEVLAPLASGLGGAEGTRWNTGARRRGLGTSRR